MTTAVFGSLDKRTDWSLTLSSPSKTMVAIQLDEVIPLLNAADEEARRGSYVAVMLCYEAAPAFDYALSTQASTALPLAWAAVFPSTSRGSPKEAGSYSIGEWTAQISRDDYNRAISKVHELIRTGDTYQVNYTFPVISQFSGDPFAYYQDLHLAQGASFSVFLDLGRYQILSLSPELFFERRDLNVRTKPMKGTVQRGRWIQEDRELAMWLAGSVKDRAENVMIVDLLRNDLGKVSITGSVRVSSLCELERFETVWQMTSTVESELKPGTSLVDLMSALFPCGSITGAPKIRTMEIIRELEPHTRGVYTGTIGFLRPGGDCMFNVAIRTVTIDSATGTALFGVGGGITIDSTAAKEYEECLVKSQFLQVEPVSFELFETMLLEDGEIFLLERHLVRLKDSANYFGFRFAESNFISALDGLKNLHRAGSWKVKLTLAKDGNFSTAISSLECGDLSPLSKERHWRIGLASRPIDPNDRFLFHKTTRRDFYLTELGARPDCDDLLFFNERGELTESSIANVVVELEGKLVTPPVSAGLLAGSFRAQLIEAGEIEERTITLAELQSITKIFLINSVRRWVQAEIICPKPNSNSRLYHFNKYC